jgi:hypothetical protein
VLIAYLGYTFTFGVHDSTVLTRSLIGVIALSILLAHLPALARRHANDTPSNQDGNPALAPARAQGFGD